MAGGVQVGNAVPVEMAKALISFINESVQFRGEVITKKTGTRG